jgi:hypothetical protein
MIHWLTLKRLTCVLTIGLTVVGASLASAEMYSDAELDAKLARIKNELVATVEIDIPALFEPADKAKFKAPKLDLPLRGRRPLDINFDGKNSRIVIPMATLQFVDDLATLKAWLDKHGCDSKEVLFPNYLHRLPKDERAMQAEGPLAAFGLRRAELLRDPFIGDVSLKYYNSSAWFLIAHEMGHAARGYQSLAGRAAIAQEKEADAFAINVLRRGRLNPAGILLYFLATSFNESLSGPRAHPTSAERIRAVALELQKSPGDFVAVKSKTRSQDAERVLKIAHDLERIADRLENNQAVQGKVEKDKGADKLAAVDADVFKKVDFARACPRGRKN